LPNWSNGFKGIILGGLGKVWAPSINVRDPRLGKDNPNCHSGNLLSFGLGRFDAQATHPMLSWVVFALICVTVAGLLFLLLRDAWKPPEAGCSLNSGSSVSGLGRALSRGTAPAQNIQSVGTSQWE
jgi:hypothetical protein